MEAFSEKFYSVLIKSENIKYGDYPSLAAWCREMKVLLLELNELITSIQDGDVESPPEGEWKHISAYCLAGIECFRRNTDDDITSILYNPDEKDRGFPLLEVLTLDRLWYEVTEYVLRYYRENFS